MSPWTGHHDAPALLQHGSEQQPGPVQHRKVDKEALSMLLLTSAAAGGGCDASYTMHGSCHKHHFADGRTALHLLQACRAHADGTLPTVNGSLTTR